MQKHLQILTLCESFASGRTSREVKDLDVAAAIRTLYYFAGSTALLTDSDNSTYHSPLGVVAIVGYYDSSLFSIVNKLAACLAAGNTCLLIPHKLSPLGAFMLAEICAQSAIPPGVVNLIASGI
jgi:acyl-CoA reductase-like NAD-dependent aldehyde dehydrogenase